MSLSSQLLVHFFMYKGTEDVAVSVQLSICKGNRDLLLSQREEL